MTQNLIPRRLRRAEEQLRKGKLPVCYSPLPGLEQLLKKYHIPMNKVFIPNPRLSDVENAKARAQHRWRFQYQRDKARLGEEVKKLTRREKEKLRDAKSKLLKELK